MVGENGTVRGSSGSSKEDVEGGIGDDTLGTMTLKETVEQGFQNAMTALTGMNLSQESISEVQMEKEKLFKELFDAEELPKLPLGEAVDRACVNATAAAELLLSSLDGCEKDKKVSIMRMFHKLRPQEIEEMRKVCEIIKVWSTKAPLALHEGQNRNDWKSRANMWQLSEGKGEGGGRGVCVVRLDAVVYLGRSILYHVVVRASDQATVEMVHKEVAPLIALSSSTSTCIGRDFVEARGSVYNGFDSILSILLPLMNGIRETIRTLLGLQYKPFDIIWWTNYSKQVEHNAHFFWNVLSLSPRGTEERRRFFVTDFCVWSALVRLGWWPL